MLSMIVLSLGVYLIIHDYYHMARISKLNKYLLQFEENSLQTGPKRWALISYSHMQAK